MPAKHPPYLTCHRRPQQLVGAGKLVEVLRLLAKDLHERGKLDLYSKLVALRHKSLARPQTLLLLTPLHILTNRSLRRRSFRHLRADPLPDAPGCVAPLALSLAVDIQHFVDKRNRRRSLQTRALFLLSTRRQCAHHRLANHPLMYTQLPCHSDNPTCPKLLLPANLFVKFHLRSPVQLPPSS